MSFTLATSGAILWKAGKYVSGDCSGALIATMCDEAEALVSSTARYDCVTNYASLTSEGKKILQDITSSYAAMGLINYDMSGYTSRTEAEIMLDILSDRVNKGLAILKEDKNKTYLGMG